METDEESQRVLPFQLRFDNPVASQIKIAEWNPEKDFLAMVTEDSKIILHRCKDSGLCLHSCESGKTANILKKEWLHLPTQMKRKGGITSLRWRPDGKTVAAGLEDGTISLHDVMRK